MKLSISNIGWTEEQNQAIYILMQKYGFIGLEIAPTRIFPEAPYDRIAEANSWSAVLKETYGFIVSSMQSIWYGRQEKLFGTAEERNILAAYTKQAIDFAAAVGCKNLVFGCPRNRNVSDEWNQEKRDASAISFFKELGDYAAMQGTVLALEANPPIYNTNYINTTIEAVKLIKKVDSPGFLLNLDVGTMIENDETADSLAEIVSIINHVHISEIGLRTIRKRKIHENLMILLKNKGYQKFVSIEMGRQDDMAVLENTMEYVRSLIEC